MLRILLSISLISLIRAFLINETNIVKKMPTVTPVESYRIGRAQVQLCFAYKKYNLLKFFKTYFNNKSR